MKKLLLVVAFIGALTLTQSARATATPLLSGLYNSVSNQLFIVNNTTPVDKKLAKSLTGALSAIQKSGGGPDAASAIKGLASVVKIVNRTSVSNAVADSVHATVLSIASQYVGTANNFSNQLSALFPSAAQAKALTAVSNLLATVNGIGTNPNVAAVVKALSGLTKQVTTIQKGVTAAQKAPAPAASITATITISGAKNFSFKGTTTVLAHTAGGNFLLNSAETTGSGTGTTLHSLAFGIYGLVSGPNTVSGSDGEYSRTSLSSDSGAFLITTSNLQLNWDDAHKTVSGTFTLGLQEQGGSRTGSVSGSFTLHYQ